MPNEVSLVAEGAVFVVEPTQFQTGILPYEHHSSTGAILREWDDAVLTAHLEAGLEPPAVVDLTG